VSVTLTGTYDGGVIRLDGPVDLEANTKVRVTVEPVPSPQHGRSFLETALELQVVGPSDWATTISKKPAFGRSCAGQANPSFPP
jgi:hypothetical protein